MSQEAYFLQLEQQINQMLAEGNFKQAYETCKKYLLQYPDNEKLLYLKEKVEDEVRIENEAIIQKKIKEMNKLLDEKKYKFVLTEIKNLINLDPNNKKLIKIALEAEEGYKKEIENSQKEFLRIQEKRLRDILKNAPKSLPSELFYLEENNRGNPQVKILVERFSSLLIKDLITKNKALLESEKYQAINNFLNELKSIDKHSHLISKVENDIRVRQHISQTSEKREYIYKVEKQLITLIKLKKFDKSIIVCREILSIDNENKLAKTLLRKAERKFFLQTRETAIDGILKNEETLKTMYKKSPEKYIKI